MNDPAFVPDAPPRTASAPVFVATFAMVLVATVLLLFVDLAVARVDRRESGAHAATEYDAGVALLTAGRPADAVDHFGTAVSIERGNVNYSLALGQAMLEAGRTADAEKTIKALLDRAENDGAVNLTMAHVMLRENRLEDANAYFHRAIFGRWGADSTQQRTQARFELIDLLARTGATRELLAELLPFEAAPPDSVALRRRLGRLFILAGAPARATTMFRELLRLDPHDGDAYEGLGEAALALGNFRTARGHFVEAARLEPGDTRIAGRLAVTDTVLSLDPTARDISSADRLSRSRIVLARTLAAVARCGQPPDAASADSARVLLSPAAKESADALSDAMLASAVDLWTARSVSCVPGVRDDDEVVRFIQRRIAQ